MDKCRKMIVLLSVYKNHSFYKVAEGLPEGRAAGIIGTAGKREK